MDRSRKRTPRNAVKKKETQKQEAAMSLGAVVVVVVVVVVGCVVAVGSRKSVRCDGHREVYIIDYPRANSL